jgi:hypothetical protein
MASEPSRIELLELDIDLRLADLWREAVDVDDWSLEIVAAFIRAAYGKGYCDALTEESPDRSAWSTGIARSPKESSRANRAEEIRVCPSAILRESRVAAVQARTTRADSRMARKASPARLDRAVVAAVLAVFLLYTSIAGGEPFARAERARRRTGDDVQLTGLCRRPGSGRRSRRAAFAFKPHDISGDSNAAVAVLHGLRP